MPIMTQKIPKSFFLQDACTVAKGLLGTHLVHRINGTQLVAQITETEAYCGAEDRACHGYQNRRTSRTEPLFLSGGHVYVYLIYGIYDLFNVVVGPPDDPSAVLIRGGVAVEGMDRIASNRHAVPYAALSAKQRKLLLDGPGRFCRGMEITRAHNRLDLLGEDLFLTNAQTPPFSVQTTPRIGIDYAGEDALLPYRFVMQKTASN